MEWTAVTVVIALVGLLLTVTTPIIKLNSAITRLTTLVDNVTKRIDRNEADNRESHKRIWLHNETQDASLNDHETRIVILEHNTKQGGDAK